MCNAGEGPATFMPETIPSYVSLFFLQKKFSSSLAPQTTPSEEVELDESNYEDEEEDDDDEEEMPQEEEKPFNPLRYRPPSVQRSSTGVHRH